MGRILTTMLLSYVPVILVIGTRSTYFKTPQSELSWDLGLEPREGRIGNGTFRLMLMSPFPSVKHTAEKDIPGFPREESTNIQVAESYKGSRFWILPASRSLTAF